MLADTDVMRKPMPDLLKNMYNPDSILKLAQDLKAVYEPFETEAFYQTILSDKWENLELKERINHIALTLKDFLPPDYPGALEVLNGIVENYGTWLDGFAFFIPTFVEMFGLEEENWELSINALAKYTRYSSAEFAVRPFIIMDEKRMMGQMMEWSNSEDEHLRRLSSEGCRPQLPWAQSLPHFKKDPSPIFPILENLKNDESLTVRRSVANNLNDISKTHPNLVASLAKEWYGKTEETDWVVKHACRTLLKKGNKEVLEIFGFHDADAVLVEHFSLSHQEIPIGSRLTISLSVRAKEETKVRLEYGIDYMKANGKPSRKIFQISEGAFLENQVKDYEKNHSFADLSTRKHYPGQHAIVLIVNGEEKEKIEFMVSD